MRLTLTGVRMPLWPWLGFYQNSNNRQNEQRTNRENRTHHEMGFLLFILDCGSVSFLLWSMPPAVTGTRVAVCSFFLLQGRVFRPENDVCTFWKSQNVRTVRCNRGGRDVKLSGKSFYVLIKCPNNISGCSVMKRDLTLLFDCHSVTCCAK